MPYKVVKHVVALTDLFDCRYIFRQTDAMVYAERLVLFDVGENGRLAEIQKYCILLYLKTIHLQEYVALL